MRRHPLYCLLDSKSKCNMRNSYPNVTDIQIKIFSLMKASMQSSSCVWLVSESGTDQGSLKRGDKYNVSSNVQTRWLICINTARTWRRRVWLSSFAKTCQGDFPELMWGVGITCRGAQTCFSCVQNVKHYIYFLNVIGIFIEYVYVFFTAALLQLLWANLTH